LGLLMTALILTLATLVTLFSGKDIRASANEEKYYTLILLLTGAMIGLVCANDLFNLWVWFEMTAITSYLLVAYYREHPPALGACVKYLIQTATGSILGLFGIALVFAQSGTLNLQEIRNLTLTPEPMIVAGTLFLIGIGVKTALAPGYTWLPDAYSQSPSGISAFLSGAVTISGLVALLRALSAVTGSGISWGGIFMALGTINIVIGNLLALQQTEIKRILAYSTVSQLSYIIMAAMLLAPLAEIGAVLHIAAHAFGKITLFFVAGAIYVAASKTEVSQLNGIGRRMPYTMVAFAVAALSMIGVPPTAGFVSKWFILAGALQTGSVFVLIVLVLSTALNAAYFLPIIYKAFFRAETEAPAKDHGEAPLPMVLALVATAVLTLLLFFFHGPLLDLQMTLVGG